jgi:hypothetical protein
VTDQDEVVELLAPDRAEHIGDVQRGIDARMKQMRPARRGR